MSLSERRKDDVPFIGSDDMYYETESGKIFDQTTDSLFDKWYNEHLGFSFRSEWIQGDVKPDNPDMLNYHLHQAFEAGKRCMAEQMYDLMRHSIMD